MIIITVASSTCKLVLGVVLNIAAETVVWTVVRCYFQWYMHRFAELMQTNHFLVYALEFFEKFHVLIT